MPGTPPDRAPERAEGEARALIHLGLLPGVGERSVLALAKAFGSARAALEAPAAAFDEVVRCAAADRREDRALEARVDEILDAADSVGARLLGFGCPGYPDVLTDLHDPPPILFLRGDAALLDGPAVAVVGSRKATGYGRRMAGRIAGALARAGVTVVSGLALGVDAAAHRGALDAGGRTLAVLGAGVDVPHPATNAALFEILAAEHLLVSEFLPGSPALSHHFPKRNRILAALSRAVVVVEAAERSGALITAEHALDLGREIVAVPGPVDRATSRGANALLRDGAHVLTAPEDVVEILSWIPGLREIEPDSGIGGGPPPALGRRAREVWEALGEGGETPDRVARRLAVSPADVLSDLSLLEMDGWVERRPGMRFARVPPAGA